MSMESWIAIGSGLIAFLGFIFLYFKPISEIKEKIGKLNGIDFQSYLTRLIVLENKMGNVDFLDMSMRMVAIETKMSLFWDAVGGVVKDIIKQPIHFRLDELLEKFPNLTEEEMCELKDILINGMPDLREKKDPKALAYALMLARIDSELYDRKQNC